MSQNKSMRKSWHSRFGGVRWRLVPRGVEVEGRGVRRTRGRPATATFLFGRFWQDLMIAGATLGIPAEAIVATLATEGGRGLKPVRHEPGYACHLVKGAPQGCDNRWLNLHWREFPVSAFREADEKTPHRVSIGIMHTLISTARSMGEPGERIDRAWLLNQSNAILVGTRYMAKQFSKTGFDPPLVAAAYNSGGVYKQLGPNNHWKLRQYPIGTGRHVDRWVAFYNDAVAVMASLSKKLPVRHETYWEF